ncbi:hypothetical protein IWW37_001495 [Coemansia sp. RSA 2050]|nr:hypothetical protein IWW37_001495 [Coemansia sp. RSA 2050]KAJ2731607.1 hypothetical protein IW152_004425 [Coemansia sp. BCRC 34962]
MLFTYGGLPHMMAVALLLLLAAVVQVSGDFNLCNAEEWRPTLKKAYIQRKNSPPPANISVKRVLEQELPKPYRILGPFAPYTSHRTHKRLTIYVDKNGMFEDVECS